MARSPSRVLMALLAAGVLAAGLGAQPRSIEKRREALERFHEMSPKERFDHVAKTAGSDKAFVAVARDDLDLAIVERGSVECADAIDVVSRLKGVVRWVIEDGTMVKKGDRLLDLDDSGLREQSRTQKVVLDQARAARLAAEADLKLARKESELAVRSGELLLKVAKLELKRDDGKDAERKEILQLKLAQAVLALEVAQLRGRASEVKAEADLKAKASAEEREAMRKSDIEAQLAECVLTAPRAGLAVHYVPEPSRFGTPAFVAMGEPVREGQKLIRVCGLERFTVLVRIHEAEISRVRVGQATQARIDAFPTMGLRGQVKEVSPVASQHDWLTRDVKVYPVVVDIPPPLPRLKPGMSAEIRIAGTRLAKVVQVPVGAVARIGREAFCYVRVGKELQERKVTLGARNALNVEVKDGLKEGEEVLRAPGR